MTYDEVGPIISQVRSEIETLAVFHELPPFYVTMHWFHCALIYVFKHGYTPAEAAQLALEKNVSRFATSEQE